jgi:hypothetical protein
LINYTLFVKKNVKEKKYQENFATSLYNIGLAYSRLGELDNGIDYAKKAYDMRKTVYEKKPHEKLAQSLSNLGMFYFLTFVITIFAKLFMLNTFIYCRCFFYTGHIFKKTFEQDF